MGGRMFPATSRKMKRGIMNIKYLNNISEISKLHREYVIQGMSYSVYKQLILESKRKHKKMSDIERKSLWKHYWKIQNWKDRIIVEWPDKYHKYVFSLNKLPETGKFRKKLDRIQVYLFQRQERKYLFNGVNH